MTHGATPFEDPYHDARIRQAIQTFVNEPSNGARVGSGAWVNELTRRVVQATRLSKAEDERDDDLRREAWADFEDQYLSDGKGYASALVYAACLGVFTLTWKRGREAALEAAKQEYDRQMVTA